MSELLAPMRKTVTWKTAPLAIPLAMFAPLYEKLAELSPQGILPPKKTTLALLAIHNKKPVNFTSRANADWADDMSSLIRAAFSKYRTIRAGSESYRRCLCKVVSCKCGASGEVYHNPRKNEKSYHYHY